MRITAELLAVAEQRTNAVMERELVLGGLGIPAIENMGVVRDDFDCYNLSNNRLIALTNFSKAHRLTDLLAAGNLIATVDVKNLSKNTPNLKYLTLSHNNITSLSQVANIGKACKKLEFLDLTGNPVTRKCYHCALDWLLEAPTEGLCCWRGQFLMTWGLSLFVSSTCLSNQYTEILLL